MVDFLWPKPIVLLVLLVCIVVVVFCTVARLLLIRLTSDFAMRRLCRYCDYKQLAIAFPTRVSGPCRPSMTSRCIEQRIHQRWNYKIRLAAGGEQSISEPIYCNECQSVNTCSNCATACVRWMLQRRGVRDMTCKKRIRDN